MIVNKLQSLNLSAYCWGRKKLSLQVPVVFHRTALSAPSQLSQLELAYFFSMFSIYFFVLSWSQLLCTCCWVYNKTPLWMFRLTWKTARTPLAMKIETFWGCITSCMTLRKNWIAAGSHINTHRSRESSIFPHLYFQPVAMCSQMLCAVDWLSARWGTESLFISYQG